MDREDAIEYLTRKGKIAGETTFSDEEEEEIAKAIKEGELYGDPLVQLK